MVFKKPQFSKTTLKTTVFKNHTENCSFQQKMQFSIENCGFWQKKPHFCLSFQGDNIYVKRKTIFA